MPRALTALTLLAACAELTGPSSSIDPADTFAVWARDHGDALIAVCHSLETSAQAQRQGSPRFVILDGDGPDARAWVGWEFRSPRARRENIRRRTGARHPETHLVTYHTVVHRLNTSGCVCTAAPLSPDDPVRHHGRMQSE
jgi:hypothetical protein